MTDNYIDRGRDVAVALDKHGFEQGTRRILYKLAEDNQILHQEVKDLSQALGALIVLTRNLSQNAAGIQDAMEKINAKFHPDNEASPDQPWS